MKLNIKSIFEYLLIVLIWVIIFGRNLFSNLAFLDFVQPTFFDLSKNLFLSEYHYNFYFFDLIKLPLTFLGLGHLLFTFSTLLAMLISYFYIKKITLIETHSEHDSQRFALIFALIFFFNPFVYSRIMVGQIGVLLSYLLMPVFIYYTFELFENNFSLKSLLKLTLVFTIVSSFSTQFFVLNFIILIVSAIWFLFYKSSKREIKHNLKKIVLAILFFLVISFLLNAHWLFGMFSTDSIFNKIDASHESFFAPKLSQGIPAVAKIIGMWGFWRESGYMTTFKELPSFLWYSCLVILTALMFLGYFFNHENKKAKIFYTLWWIGVLFATGISHPLTSPIFDFLFKNLPLFNGFRDSHKFVSLVALSYAFLCPMAVIAIKNKLKSSKINKLTFSILIALFLMFILCYTFPLAGLNNQLKPVKFTNSYYQVNDFLNRQNTENSYIIYLPWQTYLTYNWTINSSSDGRIANPINSIIEKPVLQGPDRWGNDNSLTKPITDCINKKEVSCLENAGVSFIIKDKCAYYLDGYEWIDLSSRAEPVLNTDCLDIYKLNNKPIVKPSVPLRFILGILISLLTLIGILFVLFVKSDKKQKI
ncbi:MAG TPA: hypothetical protein P5277_02280 [Candidatus Paceibacterota bacterium]|nr:hypothetical protein [Candidatus Paceibacterota bacterium]